MSNKPKENYVLGVGYYKRNEWERFLASADDREKLEDTYEEWLGGFHKSVMKMRKKGLKPRKVVIHLDELLDYCKKKIKE